MSVDTQGRSEPQPLTEAAAVPPSTVSTSDALLRSCYARNAQIVGRLPVGHISDLSMALSCAPDGSAVCWKLRGGEAVVLDAETLDWRSRRVVPLPDEYVHRALYSPQGDRLVTVSRHAGIGPVLPSLAVFDAQTLQARAHLDLDLESEASDACWGPDGTHVFVAQHEPRGLCMFDVERLDTYTGPDEVLLEQAWVDLQCVAAPPATDRRIFASAGSVVFAWDTRTRRLQQAFAPAPADGGSLCGLCTPPSGHALIGCVRAGRVVVWDRRRPEALFAQVVLPLTRAFSLASCPDAPLVCAAGMHSVPGRDGAEQPCVVALHLNKQSCTRLVVPKRMLSGLEPVAQSTDDEDAAALHDGRGEGAPFVAAAFHPTADRLLAVSLDDRMVAWSYERGLAQLQAADLQWGSAHVPWRREFIRRVAQDDGGRCR